jgi:hypothetical protein
MVRALLHRGKQPMEDPMQDTEAATPPRDRTEHRDLLYGLMTELNQTERSAARHCRAEAERLGDTPPAGALRACARHAGSALDELPGLLRLEQMQLPRISVAVGSLLSTLRDGVLDRLVASERSFRGTLLGLRHGLDVVRMIRLVADSSGRVELAGFCTRWLAQREPLVAEVERAMAWFAHHPKEALHHGGIQKERRRGVLRRREAHAAA